MACLEGLLYSSNAAPYSAPEALIASLRIEMQRYWAAVSLANTVNHIVPELAIRTELSMTRYPDYVTDVIRCGGVTEHDRLEVQPWIEEEGRFSFVTSDARAVDLVGTAAHVAPLAGRYQPLLASVHRDFPDAHRARPALVCGVTDVPAVGRQAWPDRERADARGNVVAPSIDIDDPHGVVDHVVPSASALRSRPTVYL